MPPNGGLKLQIGITTKDTSISTSAKHLTTAIPDIGTSFGTHANLSVACFLFYNCPQIFLAPPRHFIEYEMIRRLSLVRYDRYVQLLPPKGST